jgi:hypothetical protein
MRKVVVVVCVVVLCAGGGVALAAHLKNSTPGWAWYQGTPTAYLGEQSGSDTLVLGAPQGSINLRASHIRLMSDDGEFVFVHASNSPTASLNAFYLGTSDRTPIQIGDSESATGLIVAGASGQRSDLQQWTLSGQTVAAIDAKGRLRLGQVTLDPELVDGRVELFALVGSKRELLSVGVPQK